ncbi:MAG: hypothetical protein IPP71_10200 [Bacteroidetes bacterium]|nr:hypothetical protein [Bacteroidota bacterium]
MIYSIKWIPSIYLLFSFYPPFNGFRYELDKGFYSGVCKYYVEDLTIFQTEGQLENIKEKAYQLMTNTIDLNRGIYQYLSDIFNDFFPDYYYDEDDDSEDVSGLDFNQLRKV